MVFSLKRAVCKRARNIPAIDPLDGTTNFLHGFPMFAVSVAAMRNGVLEHGVVYDPLRDEMFTASRGEGAQLNGKGSV